MIGVLLAVGRYDPLRSRALIVSLLVAITIVDAITPRGIATGTLYVIPVLVAFLSRRQIDLWYSSVAASTLIISGMLLSPVSESATFLLVLTNRTIALMVLWATYGLASASLRSRGALSESERRFQLLVDGVKDYAIFELDRDGRIRTWNTGAQRLFGYEPAEVIGTSYDQLFTADERAAGVLHREMDEAARRGSYSSEGWRMRRDGTMLWANGALTALYDAPGQVRSFAKITRDLTETRRLEQQLNQAQRMESVGRMAGGIAHDFNNLLMPILGYVDVLRSRSTQDSKELDAIRRAAERAAHLTRQLLAFGRRQILRPQPTNLNEVVLDVQTLLERGLGEGIDLQLTLAPQLSKVLVDPAQLEQVLLNLAFNARDAMPAGGKLTIETANQVLDEEYARTHASVVPGPHVLLAVSDTGTGMDEHVRAHAFEPFFTTKREGGTGLGLASVYGIVKQSGGHIWIYSEPGKGATFRIYFPVSNAVAEERDADLPQAVPARPEPIEASETVLVVEDDEGVRTLVDRFLGTAGYRVLTASTPDEAIALSARYEAPIHLVLCDVVLPHMTGADLVRRLLEGRPNLRVLFMSGFTQNAIVHRGVLDAGVELLEKPFSSEDIQVRVRQVLDRGDRTS